MIKKLLNLTKYITWVHEIFHWVPAKILKVPIRAAPDRVYHEIGDQKWKTLIVVSGPLIAGLIILGGVFIATKHGLDKGWLVPSVFFIGTSIWDIRDMLYFFRHGKWSEENE